MSRTLPKITLLIPLVFILLLGISSFGRAEESPDESQPQVAKPVEVNGDRVEFFAEDKKVVAEGNVVINYEDTRLTCKKITVYSQTKDAYAEGDVHLYSPKGEISAERMKYNFEKQAGVLFDAKFTIVPFYGAGKTVEKINANEMLAKEAYLTTCDLDKPHYRLRAKIIDAFPGDKVVAKNIKVLVGNAPIFYIPKYLQPLDDNRPRVTLVPGYDKDWGAFLLQSWRYYFNENAKGTIHLDYSEKKGFAWGIDYNYKTANFGQGLIRTYYMNELSNEDHFWVKPREKTLVKERFKAEWRHKWQIDPTTLAIWQYYKLKDRDFLNDYFEKEYEKVPEPKSFFLLTKVMPSATLSFDVEKRVNHFFATIEKLPEIKLDTIDQRIGDSKFYFKNQTSYATLASKTAQPAATDPKGKQTERFDTYNQLSYQRKIGFIETRPFVAMRQTYFSRDKAEGKDLTRGIFYSGIDFTTKFYRVFDVETDFASLDIHKIRHVISPTISYNYIHPPTVPYTKLIPFDEIDVIDRKNQITLSLENKLQTKRGSSSVDLARLLLTTDYLLKYKPEGGKFRFDHIKSDLEIRPYSWLTFYSDTDFDTNIGKFSTANIDIEANGGDKWYIGAGQRYQRNESNQTTAEFAYRINPKWKLRMYERFEGETNSLIEQEYTLYRDLHCWTVELTYNQTRGEGSSIWLIFRIKAFPKMGLEVNTSYNKRKAGSQGWETPINTEK